MTAGNKQIKEMANIVSKCTTSWLRNETPKALPNHIAEALYNTGYRKASEVAREIFAEIEEYMTPLENWFLAMKQQNQDCSEEYWNGKLSAFKQLRGFIDTNLKAKYTEEQK